MGKDLSEHQHQQQPAASAESAPASRAPEQLDPQAATWSGSPETAAAKESVRRDVAASGLDPGQLGALEQAVSVPSPARQLEQEGAGLVGPELVAEVAAQEQGLRQDALVRAYEAVVVGGAAASGQPAAQQAIAQAPPEMREAAQAIAEDDSAGAPLPDDTRAKMEATFGEDFADVQVHVGDGRVDALDAGAATHGRHIHFADGAFQPGTPEGDRLIAHELTHVLQQRDAAPGGRAGVAASASPAERQAERVGEAVHEGAPVPGIAAEAAPADQLHLGEAGVHQGIELEAAGVGRDFNPDALTPQQRAALEMYSGNFIRDYSQLAAPMPLSILSSLPSVHAGGTVGAGGARTLMDAIVQAIAIMELGPEIGRALVTRPNIGVYEAEHHLDNPMGTTGPGDFITGEDTPRPAASPEPRCIQTVDARGDEIVADQGATSHRPTAETHAGSAVPGLQYENPSLYTIGEGGLATHLANSTEHAKDRFLDAVRLGPTPEGRMNVGMGAHIIEDYYSHSNFIEVALNQYINTALTARRERRAQAGSPQQRAALDHFFDGFMDGEGNPREGATLARDAGAVHAEFAFVDTLYDQRAADGRQGITTGTFGGTDTKVSLGHALLPKLPLLEASLHRGVDATFGVIDQSAKAKRKPTWETIQGLLEGQGRDGAIAQVMLEASNSVGLAVPCPTGFTVNTRQVGLPLIGQISVPTGIALTMGNVAVTDALVTGAGVYVDVMSYLDTLKRVTGYLWIDGVITGIQEAIKAAMEQLKAAVREQMSNLIRQLIIEMFEIDPKAAAHAGVTELTHLAEEQMHEMEERTSLDSRMQTGGDLHGLTQGGQRGRAELERRIGPVRPRDEGAPEETWGTEANPWVSVNPLPPSHSEISKDHPPHAHEEGDGHDHWHADSEERRGFRGIVSDLWDRVHGHDDNEHQEQHSHASTEGGSPFYELHRRLAIEADRHVLHQMEVCWGASLVPGQRVADRPMAVEHEDMLMEAAGVANVAGEAAGRAGIRHAQTDERVPESLRSRGEVRDLLNLVDYFVSHPSSSSWWKDLFDGYVAEHGDEVQAHIMERNQTRGRRKAPGE
jgi:hypothetical protein